ncbi:MAG: hypothetical protein IMZ71_05480 [Chloroflexi bacterium]|nr:hypothetical protein [Chloroflexota bacterium]
MNTGKLYATREEAIMAGVDPGNVVALDAKVTDRQRKTMQVSLHDTRSGAGQLLHALRGSAKNERRKLRKKAAEG